MRRRSQWLARRLVQLRAETGRELQGASASACLCRRRYPCVDLGRADMEYRGVTRTQKDRSK
jgi:hypothetical protein